jgi:hypothetical protein
VIITHISQRYAPEVTALRDLIFGKLNCPPLMHFSAEQYAELYAVESWPPFGN